MYMTPLGNQNSFIPLLYIVANSGPMDEGDKFDFVRYDPEVESAINEVQYHAFYTVSIYNSQVFPSDDPMDRADFDPIKYINEYFPTEQV